MELRRNLDTTTDPIATLINPPSFSRNADAPFGLPVPTKLSPNTTYYLLFEGTGGGIVTTPNGAENPGGVPGWTVGNRFHQRSSDSNGAFTSFTQTPMIRVNGFVGHFNTAPAKPGAPTVVATSPISLRVSWDEPSHAGVIGEVDDYDVRLYQGDADPADEADWIGEYQAGRSPFDPGANRSIEITGLSPGTVYRFQVRANDGSESPWSDSATAITQHALDSPEVLISNIAQPNHPTFRADFSTHYVEQHFRAGTVAGIFLVSSVEVNFPEVPRGVRVRFRGTTGYVTLKNPATVVAGVNTFTAPLGTQVLGGAASRVEITATSGTMNGKNTTDVDAGGRAGWTVDRVSTVIRKSDGQRAGLAPIGIRVNGREAPSELGSNLNQTRGGSFKSLGDRDSAGAFTTGSNATGYTLSDVILFFSGTPSAARVSLATGLPSAHTEVAVFTNPTTLARGLNTFTAPPGTTLEPSTTYYVVVEGVGTLLTTGSDAEDSDPTEFTIGDDGLTRRPKSTGMWSTEAQVQRMRVNGWINPLTRPSRPAAPRVT
ncbi:MAG: fibronectin type III domain-containing protein, partial [Gemmatimonadota bacterium]|nr:fibronectin type III domain-containing protein [Gemmatimonadota bacterium]